MQNIEELTPEQEVLLESDYMRILKIGLCSDPADRPRAEKAISEIYKLEGIEPPKFIWVDSPEKAEELIVKSTGEKKYHGTNFWGQQDSYWVLFYKWMLNLDKDFFARIADFCRYIILFGWLKHTVMQ